MPMFKDRIKLKETVELVGDPLATETTWLPVCMALEQKQIALIKPPHLLKKTTPFFQIVAALFSTLSSILVLVFAIVMAGSLFSLATSQSMSNFVDSFIIASVMGLTSLTFGTVGFWKGFYSKNLKPPIVSLSVSAFLVLMFALFSSPLPMVTITVAAISYALVLYTAAHLREAIPKTISIKKLAMSAGFACSIQALILAWNICLFSNSSSGSTSDTTTQSVLICGNIAVNFIIGCCLVPPAMAATIASRSTSTYACSVLNIFLQLPLICALTTTGLSCILIQLAFALNPLIIGELSSHAIVKAAVESGWLASLCFFATIISVCASTYVGTAIGVYINKLRLWLSRSI